MAQSIKISDTEVDILRAEAPLRSRSIGRQAEHWLRIGRAIERSSRFNYQRITEALKGTLDPDTLNAEEQEVFFDKFSDAMGETSPEQDLFFSKRKASGLGVGLDDEDNLIYQTPEKD